MGEKIGSMYYEITGDSGKLKSALQESKAQMQGVANEGKKAGTGINSSFKAIAGGVGVAMGAVGIFGVTLKKAFDLAKEAASLEYTTIKFDRLAESAGTTSKVLLNELREAVKGTRSDMELMGSAGDFMALGLANSREEVVRLTRVAGALNMNMNQLVLTLTNQTTMRFDALGVSVDGFEDKVKALKDAGMDANEAFKEAFLQQAEEQIGKVGDAAETNAGRIARLDATLKNLGDTVKLKLAGPLADASDALNTLLTWGDKLNAVYGEQRTKLLATARSYDEYAAGILWAAKGAGKLNDVTSLNVEHILSEEDVLWRVMAALGEYSETTFYAIQRANDFDEAMGFTVASMDEVANEAGDADTALKDMGDAAKGAKDDILGLNDIDLNLADTIARELDKIDYYLAGGLPLQQITADVQASLAAGKITPEQAQSMLEEVFVQEQVVQENLDNLTADDAAQNVSDTLGVSLEEAKTLILDAKKELDNFPKDIFVRLHILESGYTGGASGLSSGAGGTGEQEGYATGGSYLIPSGFTESWPLPGGKVASSGEKVTVAPVGQTDVSGAININLYNPTITTPVDYDKWLYQMAKDLKARMI